MPGRPSSSPSSFRTALARSFSSFSRQLNNYGFENTLRGRKGQPVYKNVDESIATLEDITRVRKINGSGKKTRGCMAPDRISAAADLVLALSKQQQQEQEEKSIPRTLAGKRKVACLD